MQHEYQFVHADCSGAHYKRRPQRSYEYVPEVYTAYNNNTYGCYKQVVSDASVDIKMKNLVATEAVVNEQGQRYCYAIIDVSSIINNVDKDSRYLLRVWRKVGNGDLVLLNEEDEKTGKPFVGDDGHGGHYDWTTNYSGLDLLGMEADDFAKTPNHDPFELHDTFLVSDATTPAPSGAPMLMADGGTVSIEPVTYYATLYVKDDASGKYYVKQSDEVKPNTTIPTAISTIAGIAQVESVRYYNVAGIESEKPFAGMNIVVTRYSDGTTTTTKVVK